MAAELDGKTAIVTGAGHPVGMGRAIALQLASMGANVVVADLVRTGEGQAWKESDDWSALQKVAQQAAAFGVGALPVRVDISDLQLVKAMVDAALEKFGRIDILVNNAGMIGPMIPLAEYDLGTWHKVLSVNLTGTLLCCQAVLKPMLAAGRGGRIINTASIAGKAPFPGMGPYSASKAGIISLTQTLAVELAEKGITVNAICPGNIDTAMTQGIYQNIATEEGLSFEEIRNQFAVEPAFKRIGTARDVAPLVGFLATEGAGYITGQAINVCGGIEFH